MSLSFFVLMRSLTTVDSDYIQNNGLWILVVQSFLTAFQNLYHCPRPNAVGPPIDSGTSCESYEPLLDSISIVQGISLAIQKNLPNPTLI